MLTCDHALTQIHHLLDGTLSSEATVALRAHLETCAPCRAEYRDLAATQRLLKQFSPAPEAETQERVMANFRHAVGARPLPASASQPIRNSRWLVSGFALAGACVALCFVFLTSNRSPQPAAVHDAPIQVAQLTPLPDANELAQISHLHAAQSAVALGEGAEVHQDAMLDTAASFSAPASQSAAIK